MIFKKNLSYVSGKINLINRLACCFIAVFLLVGCAAHRNEVDPVRATAQKRPDWTFTVPVPGEHHPFSYFIGLSEKAQSEQQAREGAITNAYGQLARRLGVRVQSKSKSRIQSSVSNDGELIGKGFEKKIRESLDHQIREAYVEDWYIEKYSSDEWQAWVKLAVKKEKFEEMLKEARELAKKQLEQTPFKNLEAINGYAVNRHARNLIEATVNNFSNLEMALAFQQTKPEDKPYLTAEVQIVDQDPVTKGWNSVALSYEMSLFAPGADGGSYVVKSFSDRAAGIGLTRADAIQRAQKEAANIIRPDLEEFLKENM